MPMVLPSDEVVERYRKLYDTRIEWHNEECRGRHGVVHSVDNAEFGEIADMLIFFFADKCYWSKKNPDKTYEVEFVHMAKVFPPPRRPWEWCGKSILWPDFVIGETWRWGAANGNR